jgi:ArsR family transcriptional regulator
MKALGDKNRIRILKLLEIKPLCVCEITSILGLATSTTSNHLSILKNTGLISEQKEGKWVNYYLNTTTPNPYLREMLPLLKKWVNEDDVIREDREKVVGVSRMELCSG